MPCLNVWTSNVRNSNPGYSLKDGKRVEQFIGNRELVPLTWESLKKNFRESMCNVVNHAITKAIQKNLASFSASLAADNEVILKNITCKLRLDHRPNESNRPLRDASVEQKTFADISNDISSETQTLMEDVKNKSGVDLNGVVDTIGSTVTDVLGVGNSSTKSKTEIYNEVGVKTADQIQNGTKDTIDNVNITEFMDAARAENSAELQEVTCRDR